MVTNNRAHLGAATHRHSLDGKQGSPAPSKRDVTGLRKEQSSPAVVQHAGDCSLLKAVVSASGQGAPALLNAPAGGQTNKPIWRSRCVPAALVCLTLAACSCVSGRQHCSDCCHCCPCRSVRNKLESYAILQLKGQSNRDVTVQVSYLANAAELLTAAEQLMHLPVASLTEL
jgi:hypothetical protein